MARPEIAGEPIEKWEEQLRIDVDSLDHEIEKQPYLFYQVASAYAQAISERDGEYDYVKQTDAELNFEVRDTLANEGHRVTEELVKSAVQKHPSHVEAYNSYLKKRLVADELDALRSAFQQRGYMLRDLAQLYTTGYLSQSAVPGGPSPYKSGEKVSEHNREHLRSRLQRTPRGDRGTT